MTTFEKLDLIAPVQRALSDEKYEKPTPIQAKTIPPALEGRDVIGCAQTGTGKTAAFALPILNRLGRRKCRAIPHRPLALVLVPTRELAIQIGESFATYGQHLPLRHVVVYGGVNQSGQIQALRQGAHLLVGTPGRLLDLMTQGHIKLDELEVFVLDEADRMLDMGFLPDLKRIMKRLPDERQSLFFSATLPKKIIELAKQLLTNPVHANVTPRTTSLDNIEQRVLGVERADKQARLLEILAANGVERVLVFTRTKRGANLLSGKLLQNGISATAINGNKSQASRKRALDDFRESRVQVLVATDIAARGLDIDGITHVVNFDLPQDPETYVHRIGRTGRAGASGVALSFCAPNERAQLEAIERLIGAKVPVFDWQLQSNWSKPESRKREAGNRGALSPSHVRDVTMPPMSTPNESISRPSPIRLEPVSTGGKPYSRRRPRRQTTSGGRKAMQRVDYLYYNGK